MRHMATDQNVIYFGNLKYYHICSLSPALRNYISFGISIEWAAIWKAIHEKVSNEQIKNRIRKRDLEIHYKIDKKLYRLLFKYAKRNCRSEDAKAFGESSL